LVPSPLSGAPGTTYRQAADLRHLKQETEQDHAEKGAPVTTDQPSGPDEAGTAAGTASLPFDTSVANQAQTGSDLLAQESIDGLRDIVTQMRLQPGFRSREQVARFFEGTELLEPGLVPVEQWRPDPSADAAGKSILWCAVGRKP
jgi:S-adenosyl methyltransferase